MSFSDRIKKVAGTHPFAWAKEHGFTKSVMQSLLVCEKPQRKTLERLVSVTGITADWWLNGEGEPPKAGPAQQAVQAGPTLVYSAGSDKSGARISEPPVGHIHKETLCEILRVLEDELARKNAMLDPARKAEVITLLYEEAMEEPDGQRRKERILRLVSLVA